VILFVVQDVLQQRARAVVAGLRACSTAAVVVAHRIELRASKIVLELRRDIAADVERRSAC
jgi:hypothetical protein